MHILSIYKTNKGYLVRLLKEHQGGGRASSNMLLSTFIGHWGYPHQLKVKSQFGFARIFSIWLEKLFVLLEGNLGFHYLVFRSIYSCDCGLWLIGVLHWRISNWNNWRQGAKQGVYANCLWNYPSKGKLLLCFGLGVLSLCCGTTIGGYQHGSKKTKGESSQAPPAFDRTRFVNEDVEDYFHDVLVGKSFVIEQGLRPDETWDDELYAMIMEHNWYEFTKQPTPTAI